MQEDKVMIQDRMGTEHMHQPLQKEDRYRWRSQMDLKQVVVDTLPEWKEGSKAVHSAER